MKKIKSKIFEFLLRRKLKVEGPARPIAELDKKKVQKILVVSSTALGDTVFSLPAIISTRKLFPEAEISWFFKKEGLRICPMSLLFSDALLRMRNLHRIFLRGLLMLMNIMRLNRGLMSYA